MSLARFALFLIPLILFYLTGCCDDSNTAPSFETLSTNELVNTMSLEQKIGQLFMVGLPGETIDAKTSQRINSLHIGAFILFSKNTPDPLITAQLTRSLQDKAEDLPLEIPLLFAIDQEQGRVTRLEKGVTLFPGNYALGKIGDGELTKQAAYITGSELKVLGINANLAPVCDINSNPENPIIGTRSFGEVPHAVAQMAISAVQGYRASGILPCAKHFPGHGDVAIDSHLELPVINKNLAELQATELVPFLAAVQAGVPIVMTAHILFPELDPACPATASPAILEGLLRSDMGFTGVILSDALEMQALAKHYRLPDLAVKIINSGCDMLLFSENLDCEFTFEEIYAAVLQAAQEESIPAKRLDEAVTRILDIKKQCSFTALTNNEIQQILRQPENLAFSYEVIHKAIGTNEDAKLFPLDLTGKKLAILSDIESFAHILQSQNAQRLLLTNGLQADEIDQATRNVNEIWLFVNQKQYVDTLNSCRFPNDTIVRVFSLNDPYLRKNITFRHDSYLNLFAYKIPVEAVEEYLSK